MSNGLTSRDEVAALSPMTVTVRRKLAWTSLAKPAVLFLLPAPLLVANVAALVAGDVHQLALAGGALASFWSAGALAFRGVLEEARYRVGQRLLPAAFPWKRLSAVPTALGSGLAAGAAGHDLPSALVFATLAAVGHLAFIGTDPRRRPIAVAQVQGVDCDEVTRQLERAEERLRAIERAGRSLALPEFRERLSRIAQLGQTVLVEIERNPAVAPHARRFLNLYLDDAERVTVEYARGGARGGDRPLDQNFRQLLVEMEATFSEQHRLLVQRTQLLLDADIEVLNTRLTQEGPG